MSRTDLDRRTFLRATGVAGGVALAGCTGGGGTDDDGGDDTPADDDTPTDDGGSGGSTLDEEPGYSDWFDGANEYDATVDERDADSVTVKVGAGNGLAFDPAAVAVSTGTEVTWEWTGEGGSHNVVSRDDAFESEFSGEEGHTFTHTFEEAGTYEYYCDPHEASGMKGAVYVE